MSAPADQILERRAGQISWSLRSSGIDNRYLHSAARHLITRGLSTRDSEVIKEAKRRRQMVVAAVSSHKRRDRTLRGSLGASA